MVVQNPVNTKRSAIALAADVGKVIAASIISLAHTCRARMKVTVCNFLTSTVTKRLRKNPNRRLIRLNAACMYRTTFANVVDRGREIQIQTVAIHRLDWCEMLLLWHSPVVLWSCSLYRSLTSLEVPKSLLSNYLNHSYLSLERLIDQKLNNWIL